MEPRGALAIFALVGVGALVGWVAFAPPAPRPAARRPAASPAASTPTLRLERLGPREARVLGPAGQDLGRLAVDAQGKVSGDALGKLPLHAARLGTRVRILTPSGLAPEVAEKAAVLLRRSGSLATIAPLSSS